MPPSARIKGLGRGGGTVGAEKSLLHPLQPDRPRQPRNPALDLVCVLPQFDGFWDDHRWAGGAGNGHKPMLAPGGRRASRRQLGTGRIRPVVAPERQPGPPHCVSPVTVALAVSLIVFDRSGASWQLGTVPDLLPSEDDRCEAATFLQRRWSGNPPRADEQAARAVNRIAARARDAAHGLDCAIAILGCATQIVAAGWRIGSDTQKVVA
jgi:hypothetical protein